MASQGEAAIVVSWSEGDTDLAGYCGAWKWAYLCLGFIRYRQRQTEVGGMTEMVQWEAMGVENGALGRTLPISLQLVKHGHRLSPWWGFTPADARSPPHSEPCPHSPGIAMDQLSCCIGCTSDVLCYRVCLKRSFPGVLQSIKMQTDFATLDQHSETVVNTDESPIYSWYPLGWRDLNTKSRFLEST